MRSKLYIRSGEALARRRRDVEEGSTTAGDDNALNLVGLGSFHCGQRAYKKSSHSYELPCNINLFHTGNCGLDNLFVRVRS